MYRHSRPLSKGQREMGDTVNTFRTSISRSEVGGRHFTDTQHPYPKIRGEVGTTWYKLTGPLSKGESGGWRQCTDTQDLYLKVRGEVGTKCTETWYIYLKVRGEVGAQCTHTQDL